MRFKQNVIVIFNSRAQYTFARVDSIWKDIELEEAVLTSGVDGTHGPNSLHYQGRAWDFRLPKQVEKVMAALKLELGGADYDVLLEGDHIHIEYDPKLRRGL